MTKRTFSPIVGNRVRLRPLSEPDLSLTRQWRNQDHIRRWFFNSNVISEEQHQAWFEQYLARDDDFVFIIQESASLRAAGQVALYHIDWSAQRAEFGRLMIGEPDVEGKGLASEATKLLVSFAMRTWGLNQIYLEVFANNARAIAIYAKCGFAITERRDNILMMNLYADGSKTL
jgi:diamine N-acetyltransferase